MGGPLKLKFANHFIIYQNCPLRGHFGTGRLHSQLWDWGVKIFFAYQFFGVTSMLVTDVGDQMCW